jgi:O-Antigen ligase
MTAAASVALAAVAIPLGLLLVFACSVVTVRLALMTGERRTFGAAVLLLAYLIETALVAAPSVEVGLNITTNDVAALLVLLAMGVGAGTRPWPLQRPVFLLWLGFTAILLMNLAIGLDTHGTTAGVEIRPTFGFLVAALYFCVIDFTQDDVLRMARWCTLAGWGLVGIALVRWIGVGTGMLPLSAIVEVGAGNEFRALRSDAAFFLALLSLGHFLAWLRGRGGRLAGMQALLFGSVVVVLQHRSAWGAYAAGLLLVLVHQHRHLWRRLPFLLAFALLAGGGLAIAATFGTFDRLLEALVESAVSVGNTRSTASDRIDAWDTLLSEWRAAGTWDILFGFPFGHGFRWYINHRPVDFQPHNFYVFLLLRTGACGLLLFMLASATSALYALFTATRDETDDLLVRGLGVAMFCMLVYFVPYQGVAIHGALTGLAMGLLVHRVPAAATRRRPAPVVAGHAVPPTF